MKLVPGFVLGETLKLNVVDERTSGRLQNILQIETMDDPQYDYGFAGALEMLALQCAVEKAVHLERSVHQDIQMELFQAHQTEESTNYKQIIITRILYLN